MSVELALLAPALLLLLSFAVVAGRTQIAEGAVQEPHGPPPGRPRSPATPPPPPLAGAQAERTLAAQDLRCEHTTVDVDTAGFQARSASPATSRCRSPAWSAWPTCWPPACPARSPSRPPSSAPSTPTANDDRLPRPPAAGRRARRHQRLPRRARPRAAAHHRLAVDGGAKVAATQRANAIADEAARAGGQALDISAALTGQVQVDPVAAVAAAQDYLDRNDVQGAVTVVDGDTLHVTTTISQPTTFLGLIGISTLTVEGSGTADLIAAPARTGSGPMTTPPRALDLLRRLLALLVLAAAVAGIPIALWQLGGAYLPDELPSWAQVTTALGGPTPAASSSACSS